MFTLFLGWVFHWALGFWWLFSPQLFQVYGLNHLFCRSSKYFLSINLFSGFPKIRQGTGLAQISRVNFSHQMLNHLFLGLVSWWIPSNFSTFIMKPSLEATKAVSFFRKKTLWDWLWTFPQMSCMSLLVMAVGVQASTWVCVNSCNSN